MLVKLTLIFFSIPIGIFGFRLFALAWFSELTRNGVTVSGFHAIIVRLVIALFGILFMIPTIWSIAY